MSWRTIMPNWRHIRTSLRARNVHRLDGIAGTSKNDMARVASIKVLEQLADTSEQQYGVGQSRLPGVQIVIVQQAPPARIGDMPVIPADPSPMLSLHQR